jgi:hypothetical protein
MSEAVEASSEAPVVTNVLLFIADMIRPFVAIVRAKAQTQTIRSNMEQG